MTVEVRGFMGLFWSIYVVIESPNWFVGWLLERERETDAPGLALLSCSSNFLSLHDFSSSFLGRIRKVMQSFCNRIKRTRYWWEEAPPLKRKTTRVSLCAQRQFCQSRRPELDLHSGLHFASPDNKTARTHNNRPIKSHVSSLVFSKLVSVVAPRSSKYY